MITFDMSIFKMESYRQFKNKANLWRGEIPACFILVLVKLNTVNAVRPLTEDVRRIAAKLPAIKNNLFHPVKGDCSAWIA